VKRRRWLHRNSPAEAGIAADLLPWGQCVECGALTQWRVVERVGGVPNGREWFCCESHL